MKDNSKTYVFIPIALFAFVIPIQLSLPIYFDIALVFIACIVIFLFSKYLKIELGLDNASFKRAIKPALIFVALIGVLIGVAYLIRPQLFLDERYQRNLVPTLAYIFLVIPFRTAFFEEVLFRGFLFSSFSKTTSSKKATILSSVMFGLWHIPASRSLNANSIDTSIIAFEQLAIIFVVVVITAFAGLILSYLRTKFESLYVPIAVHWAINGFGVLFTYLAWN